MAESAQHDRGELAVTGDRGIAGAAHEMLDHLTLDETGAHHRAVDSHSFRRDLSAKAVVQHLGRLAIHPRKCLVEASIHTRRETPPDIDETRITVATRQPLEKRRAGEIREVASLEVTPVAHLFVGR